MGIHVGPGISGSILEAIVFRNSVAPNEGRLGDLWCDTSGAPPVWKKCTSTSPYVWSSIEGGAGGAPADADYLVLSLNGTLTNERRFVPGTNLSAVDGGPGGTYTLNASGGGGGGPALSAGTQSVSTGTVVFSNSNNVSFGMSNSSVVTASASFAPETPFGVSAGTQSVSTGTLVFSNSNNVSFGMSGSSQVTASFSTQPETPFAVSAGTQSVSTGTVSFANSNGISFGMSGSSQVTASYTVPTVPAQFSAGNTNSGNTQGDTGAVTGRLVFVGTNNITLSGSTNGGSMTISISGGAGAAGNTGYISAGTATASLGTVSFANSNGVSFGVSGQTVTGSISQSNQTVGAYAVSNTTQSSSGTIDARSLSFQGNGGVSAGVSNGSVVLSVAPASNLTVSGFLSLSTNGNTMTIGAGPLSFYATGNTTQSSSGTIDGRSITIQGTGGVSAGISNGSIVISGATGGGGGGGIGAGVSTAGNTAGSTGTVTTGNLVLVGSGPISLSQSTGAAGSNATITINAPATSSLSATGFVSIATNGSTISIGAGPLSFYATNNTTQSSSGTIDGRSITFNALGIASIGVSNGSVVVSVPSGGGAGDGVNIIAAGTQTANTTGTVLFQNSNGLTFGMSNSSVVTASYTVPTITSWTASDSATSMTIGRLAFTNSNGLTMTLSTTTGGSATLIGSYTRNVASNAIQSVGSATGSGTNTSRFAADDHVHAGVFSAGVSTAGNTAGNTRVDVGQFVLQGGNNITLSQVTAANAANTIVISGPNVGGAQTGISGIVASDATYTSGTVLFSNQANVTIGSSVNGASQYVRLSVAAQTNQSAIQALGVSNTGNTAGNTGVSTGINFVIAGSNGITASQSTAGGGPNTIWLSGVTTAAQSNQTGGIYVTAQSTGQSSSSTYDVRTLSFVPDGIISAGWSGGSFRVSATQSNQAASASNGSFTFQTLNFSNANNVTFGTSAGGVVTASVGAGAGGSESVGMSTQTAGGATAGTTGYASGSAIQYLLVPGSNITMSQSVNGASGTMSIYAPAPGAAAENNNINLLGANTAGNTTASGSTLGFSGLNLTLSGTNNSQIVFSAPATSSLVGTNGISISTNGSTISISNMQYTGSWFEPEVYGGTTTVTQGQGTVYFRPFYLNNYLTVDRMNLLMQMTSQSQTTARITASVSNSSSSSGTASWGLSGTGMLFSRVSTGTNANSSNIISFFSKSYSLSVGYSNSARWTTNASSATCSWTTSAGIGFISQVGSDGAITTGSSGTSGSSTFSSTSTNQNSFSSSYAMTFASAHLSQVRALTIPMGTMLSPGEYWFAHIQSTATGSTNYSWQNIVSMNSAGLVHYSSNSSGYAEIGNSATIATSNLKWGIGSYSASSQTSTTIPISQITAQSNYSLFFNLLGQVD